MCGTVPGRPSLPSARTAASRVHTERLFSDSTSSGKMIFSFWSFVTGELDFCPLAHRNHQTEEFSEMGAREPRSRSFSASIHSLLNSK